MPRRGKIEAYWLNNELMFSRKIINVMEASSFKKGGGAVTPGLNDSGNEDSKRRRNIFHRK